MVLAPFVAGVCRITRLGSLWCARRVAAAPCPCAVAFGASWYFSYEDDGGNVHMPPVSLMVRWWWRCMQAALCIPRPSWDSPALSGGSRAFRAGMFTGGLRLSRHWDREDQFCDELDPRCVRPALVNLSMHAKTWASL